MVLKYLVKIRSSCFHSLKVYVYMAISNTDNVLQSFNTGNLLKLNQNVEPNT